MGGYGLVQEVFELFYTQFPPMSRTLFLFKSLKTSLLCRLQAQNLSNATSPIGQIHPFSKMAAISEPLKRIVMSLEIKKVLDNCERVYFSFNYKNYL